MKIYVQGCADCDCVFEEYYETICPRCTSENTEIITVEEETK